MVKIKLISDVHTEHDRDGGDAFVRSLSSDDVDILVVAGDLTDRHHKMNLTRLCESFKDVVYVMGNHDYWHSSLAKRREEMTKICEGLPNLHWLDNTRKQIQGKWFAGCTLWFSREDCPRLLRWPDFRFVSEGPDGIWDEFDKSYEFLNNNIEKGDIVVTHHLPSKQCVHPRWEGSTTNCFFVGDVEDIILRKEPAFWFFGHTHDSRHLMVWKTELFCNPRGYPHEGVPFDSNLIIDTDIDKQYT
jgi:Icc-related predicted phosphoesterase